MGNYSSVDPLSKYARRYRIARNPRIEIWRELFILYVYDFIPTTRQAQKYTPKGSRTPAACLEGKHDNRFTIGVHVIGYAYHCRSRLARSPRPESARRPASGGQARYATGRPRCLFRQWYRLDEPWITIHRGPSAAHLSPSKLRGRGSKIMPCQSPVSSIYSVFG